MEISEQVIDSVMNSFELDVVVLRIAISISQALVRLLVAIAIITTASVDITFTIRNTPAIIIVKPMGFMECCFANIAWTSLEITAIIAGL